LSQQDPLAEIDWPKPVAPSEHVSQAIHQKCTKGLGSHACVTARRKAALTLLVPVLTVGAFTVLAVVGGGVPEGALRSALYGALGWAVVLALVLLFGLARPPGRRPAAALRVLVAVLVPVVFFVYLSVTASGQLPFATFAQGATAEHALGCGMICLLVGAIVTGAVLLLWRGTDPMTPGVSGALAGLVGGVGSALALGVACPSQEGWHLGFSHGLVVVALVILGGAVGRRLLSP
jgi:hypothetical protein